MSCKRGKASPSWRERLARERKENQTVHWNGHERDARASN